MDQISEALETPENPGVQEILLKQHERLLSDWSYAAGTGKHGSLATQTNFLAKLLATADLHDSLRPVGLKIGQTILKDYLKSVYTSLFLSNPQRVLPALNLLGALCKYSSGALIIDLYENFDFTLKSLPKILKTQSLRPAFIQFYVSLISRTKPALRKDLLDRKVLVSAWVRGLSSDPAETVKLSLDCFKKFVVDDKSLSRGYKMSLFNDKTLKHFLEILKRLDDLAEPTSTFLVHLFLNKDTGLAFPDSGWYGHPNNKQALALLQELRPWENIYEMDLTLCFLRNISELILPYFEHIAPRYPFNPKLTMFWYAYSVLHIRAIELPLPRLDSLQPPSRHAVINSILPVSIGPHLAATVDPKSSYLVRFQGAQIILRALRKLGKLLEVYSQNGWDSEEVYASIMNRLPDLHVLLRTTGKDLLDLVFLACVKEHNSVQTYGLSSTVQQSLAVPHGVTAVLDRSNVHGLDLIRAQMILEIQTHAAGQTKWWNTGSDDLSFFTKTVRFATRNPGLANASVKLLDFLVSSTLLVHRHTVASALEALEYTLEATIDDIPDAERAQLWKLLDEAVSRTIRAPFPYIDVFSTDISPIAVALVEQYKYMIKTGPVEGIKRWLYSYIRSLGIIGEDKTATTKLLQDLGHTDLSLSQDDYFEFVLSAPEWQIMKRQDIGLKIGTALEFMATVSRVASDESAKLAAFLLDNIPSTFAGYLGHPSCFRAVLEQSVERITLFISSVASFEAMTEELSRALAESQHWRHFLQYLPTDFLTAELRRVVGLDRPLSLKIVQVLTNRQLAIPEELIHHFLDFPDQIRLQSLTKDQGKSLIERTSDVSSIAALVQASGYFSHKLPSEPEILLSASRFAPEAMDSTSINCALNVAVSALYENTGDSLSLLVLHQDHLNDQQLSKFAEFLGKEKNALQSGFAVLALKLSSDNPNLQVWLRRSILQLTKSVTERKHRERTREFTAAMTAVVAHFSLWNSVNSNLLNAFISSVLSSKSPESAELHKLVAAIVWSAPKVRIDHSSHLQALLYSTKSYPDGYDPTAAATVWKLFKFDTQLNSTEDVQRGVLLRYGGTCGGADILLLDVLRSIETETGSSWAENLIDLEVKVSESGDEYEVAPLFSAVSGNWLVATLEKQKIDEFTKSYDPFTLLSPPHEALSFPATLELLLAHDIVHMSHLYNEEFVINLLLSSSLMADGPKVDVKSLTESGLLALAICCTSSNNTDVSQVARSVLSRVAQVAPNGEKTYRDDVAVYLIVNKFIYYLENNALERAPGHIAVLTSEILRVAVSPSHFLHELVTNWLLAGPSIQSHTIPLYNEILSSTSEHKPKELLWLINAMTAGLVDKATVGVYIKAGVVEWALSLQAVTTPKYSGLNKATDALLAKVADVGGSLSIIRRCGGLSYTSPGVRIRESAKFESLTDWMGLTDSPATFQSNSTA